MSNSIHSESNNNSENSSIVSEQDKYNPEQNSMREPSSDLGRKPLTFILLFLFYSQLQPPKRKHQCRD